MTITPINYISPLITTRFREVQEILSFIKSSETSPPSAETIILRGLFYVHLYGAFEFSVNEVVQASVEAINAAQVPYNRVTHALEVLVLNSAFRSIKDASAQQQWQKRADMINLRLSSLPAKIDDGVIDLQNIWIQTIKLIYRVFDIQKPALKDVTRSGYIRELVDTRNKIAHGAESPSVAGRRKNCAELQVMFNAIQDQAFYMLDCFDNYLANAKYMR